MSATTAPKHKYLVDNDKNYHKIIIDINPISI